MTIPSPDGAVKKGSPAPSPLVIGARHLLHGNTLDDVGEATLIIENGRIVDIEQGVHSSNETIFDAVMPLPVNAHIHMNDYRIPEACIGLSLAEYVGRKGIKHPLIRLFREPLLPVELGNILVLYSIVADFQEIHDLCRNYREKLGELGVRYVGLSRPRSWYSTNSGELEKIAAECGGIGISNPSSVPPWILQDLASISRKRPVTAHISETPIMEKHGGLHYLLNAGIRLTGIVHGVFLEDWELRMISSENIVLIINPRSNLWFTGRVARIDKLVAYGGSFALGTDNAGCFHPDVFAEAEMLYSLFPTLDPRLIVSAMTINGYRSLGLEPGLIVKGSEALFLGLDLGLPGVRSRNIYASIIRRGLWARRALVFKKDTYYIIDKLVRRIGSKGDMCAERRDQARSLGTLLH